MEFNQIKELIQLVDETNISELKIEHEGFKLSLKTKAYTEAVQQSKQSSTIVATPVAAPAPLPVHANLPTMFASSSMVAPRNDANTSDSATASSPSNNSNTTTIKSPMIGTFYRSPAPDKPNFINVGDQIKVGQVLCIVEAMKLFNEIEAEISGKVVEILINDASPVEFDQPLFLVEPA
ncbi:MAG: acetyl-CoA carboxylase biotin carboxyl carrier protein [Chitinophagales bacterium]